MVVGGYYDGAPLSSVELFPRPSSDACAIPDLPQPRQGHSVSLLSGGRLVVCGGVDRDGNRLRSCIYWAAGNNSWTHFFDTRCLPSSECNSGQNYFCYQLSIQVPFRYHILPVPVLFHYQISLVPVQVPPKKRKSPRTGTPICFQCKVYSVN